MTNHRPEQRRLTLGRLMVGIAVLGLVLSVATPVAVQITDRMTYNRVQRESFDLIVALQTACPANVSPNVWEDARGWAQTAYANVCFGPGHVTYAELVRFRDDLRARLNQGPADLRTLDWIWDRLARTGPHGEYYVRRYGPYNRPTIPPGM